MGNGGRRQVAAEIHAGHDQRARPEQRAGIEHGIATDLGPVAEDGAELPQPGADHAGVGADGDLALVEPEVGADHARPEVRAIAENRVAHVVVVRRLDAVEQQAVLELARIAQHAALPGDHVPADEGTRANVGAGPDPGGPEDRGIGGQLDRRMEPDLALQMDARRDGRLQGAEFAGLQRLPELLQPFPGWQIGRKEGGETRQRRRQGKEGRGFHKPLHNKKTAGNQRFLEVERRQVERMPKESCLSHAGARRAARVAARCSP